MNSRGFPVRYASESFKSIYGFQNDEVFGQSCGQVFGGPAILAEEGCLAEAARQSGLSLEGAREGVCKMTAYAASQVKSSVDANSSSAKGKHYQPATGHASSSGCMLLLNRRKSGELFVCELVVGVNRHPVLGWCYCIGLQRDVTKELSVKDLMRSLADGKYETLVARRDSACHRRLA